MEDKDLEARKTLEYYDCLDWRYGDATVYQEHAMRTAIAQSAEGKLHHGVFGLASEAGEVSGILQKVYQGHGDPFESDEVKLQMKIQLDNLNRNSIDKHEAMKQIHQSVCPKQVKGSDFWNAALVEVEERLRGL